MDEQYNFEFKDWEEAFEMFYRKRLGYKIYDDNGKYLGKRLGNPKIVFIISTAFYSSGYWVEEAGQNARTDAETKVYRSVKAVKELETRIRGKRESKNTLAIGLVV